MLNAESTKLAFTSRGLEQPQIVVLFQLVSLVTILVNTIYGSLRTVECEDVKFLSASESAIEVFENRELVEDHASPDNTISKNNKTAFFLVFFFYATQLT